MKYIKYIAKFIKYKIKQIFCKHSYEQISKFYGHNNKYGKDVIFNYNFKCVKCGKEIFINMDEDTQLKTL